MADLNLRAAFFPTYRADPASYWLGLGVIALLDAVRLSFTSSGLLPWLVVLFFVACININRLRDAGRQGPLVIIPLGAGVVAKSFVAFFAMTFALMPDLLSQLREAGVETFNDPQAQEVLYSPAFQEAYQRHLESNPEIMLAALQAGDWPSTWAFWLAIAGVGLWFSKMRPRPRAV